MAFYRHFWDLASSTTFTTHTVGSFDANCSSGTGTFRWVPSVANATLPNIPGIRIKPTSQGTGYWIRVFEGPMNVGWFGCQNTTTTPLTFAALGIGQATLDERYGAGFATTFATGAAAGAADVAQPMYFFVLSERSCKP